MTDNNGISQSKNNNAVLYPRRSTPRNINGRERYIVKMASICACVKLLVLSIWFSALRGLIVCAQDEVCTIGDQSFLPGESFGDAVPTRCGDTDEWPCFCNPELPNSAECPYCSFSAGDGTLYCAKDGQNVTFRDGSISRACTCEIPDDPTESPIRDCTVIAAATGCNWFDLNGDPVFFEDGESFGDSIDGACGPSAEWPSFCYVPPGSAGGDDFVIDYPYCVFSDTASGEDLCSKDGETLDYVNNNDTELSCNCAYSTADGPITTCDRIGSSPPRPSDPPDESTTDSPNEAPSPDVTPAPFQPPRNSGGLPRRHRSTKGQKLSLALSGIIILHALAMVT